MRRRWVDDDEALLIGKLGIRRTSVVCLSCTSTVMNGHNDWRLCGQLRGDINVHAGLQPCQSNHWDVKMLLLTPEGLDPKLSTLVRAAARPASGPAVAAPSRAKTDERTEKRMLNRCQREKSWEGISKKQRNDLEKTESIYVQPVQYPELMVLRWHIEWDIESSRVFVSSLSARESAGRRDHDRMTAY